MSLDKQWRTHSYSHTGFVPTVTNMNVFCCLGCVVWMCTQWKLITTWGGVIYCFKLLTRHTLCDENRAFSCFTRPYFDVFVPRNTSYEVLVEKMSNIDLKLKRYILMFLNDCGHLKKSKVVYFLDISEKQQHGKYIYLVINQSINNQLIHQYIN